jgi:SH3 domain protein
MARVHRMVLSVGFMLFLTCQTSWATKAYVTDSFRISLRRGPGTEAKILKFVPSGIPVEVFETQDGWCRVRLTDGEEGVLEGWVLSRYLVDRLPWEDQAKNLMAENAKLKEELARIDKKWEATLLQEQQLNKDIKEKYESTRKRAEQLDEENDSLRASRSKKWFTTGGLVMFSGLLVGLFMGKQPGRRRLSF